MRTQPSPYSRCGLVQPTVRAEKETHKYVSEPQGKETIPTTGYNRSKGRNGSYSINHQQSGRDLMTPDEVRLLDNGKCILFIRGGAPCGGF